jgi:serine/threonine protein kinase
MIFSRIVGYGATSVVFKASYYNDEDLDQNGKPKKETVAIKKVKNIFESDVYTHRVLRELRLLRILQGHNNVSKLFLDHINIVLQIHNLKLNVGF